MTVEFPPIIVERGEGAYIFDVTEKRYLDAVSSWWVNLFGHCNKRINDSVKRQLDSLEHVIFANFSHKPAIELAEKIFKITPQGLNKVFFADNGSSAVEIALKLSFQYHQQTGSYDKKRFIALSDAYHGETLGALSVGDLDLYSKIYKPLMIDTLKVSGPDCYRCKYGAERTSCRAECFGQMQKAIEENHNEVCAVIIEPIVQAAAGMKIYSPQYLIKLREICSRIFDEEDVLNVNKVKSELINKLTEPLVNAHPYVGEFRQIGMIAALELVENKETKKTFDWEKRVGYYFS